MRPLVDQPKISIGLVLYVMIATSGCAPIAAVAVITENGEVLTGTTATLRAGGAFTVSNQRMQCTGRYAPTPGELLVH